MAKFEICKHDVEETINALKSYRSGWANDIREGWNCGMQGAKEVLYELYEISGTIILALENRLAGSGVDKMAMHMTLNKLEKFVKSELFDEFSVLGEAHACNVVTSGTNHHIRVMFECLEVLTA
ncbi:MAG: hypothetical protein IJV97_01770 [Alphaproteobacteria bacterium]|nr:hypothetical protein [Alphaproteobacteria bacterium]